MSILNGSIRADVIRDEEMPFGQLLPQTDCYPISGCFDVAVDEQAQYAYVAHQHALSIFDLTDTAHPVWLSTLEGLGSSRQIVVQNSYAYITARADGLYIVDVSDVKKPKLASHFDTVELATGIAVSGNLCLVANRHLGVEFIDVSDPAAPVFITSVLAGEAQSVCMDGSFVYVGDWMNKFVHVFDISNTSKPVKISTISVDGYADGVFARDGYCYIATGHHSTRLKNRRKYHKFTYVIPQMIEDGYGCGHGMEIFDVSNPYRPEYVSSVKFPPLYVSGFDTWLVTVSGKYAYVSDTYNGLFVVDVSNIGSPSFKGYYRLPIIEKPQPASPPSLQNLSYPITGIAPANGYILAAGFMTGLHVVKFDECATVPVCANTTYSLQETQISHKDLVFSCNGQVHTVDFCDGAAIIAAGNDGLVAVDANNPQIILHHNKEMSIVHDVQVLGHLVVAAEGQQGVSIYEYSTENGFILKDRYGFGSDSAREIVLFHTKRIVAVQLACNTIGFLQITPEDQLELIDKLSGLGNLYHRHLCRTPLDEKYIGLTPLTEGFIWYDLSGESPKRTSWAINKQSCPIEEGGAVIGQRTILIQKQNYVVIEKPEDIVNPETLVGVKVNGALLNGQPFVCGSLLLLLNRCDGTVEFINIKDIYNPLFVKRISLPGSPEYAAFHNGKLWVCCGHGGLFAIKIL
jgi:hypothetical protein